MKRLNIKLPDDLHTRLKVAVALEQTNISEVVRKFLEQYVAKVEKAHEQKRTK
jgi:metal-responsive CopG/Arc/MetJ family transcriptional regulator